MTAISMRQRTFWLWDSQLLPVERWSDLDGRKLAQAHLREAGKPTREGGNPAWGAGNPRGLPMGRMSTGTYVFNQTNLFKAGAYVWFRRSRGSYRSCFCLLAFKLALLRY